MSADSYSKEIQCLIMSDDDEYLTAMYSVSGDGTYLIHTLSEKNKYNQTLNLMVGNLPQALH